MNERESLARGHVPVINLSEQDRLRIRLGAVSVDSIPRGGGRALFEFFSSRNEPATALTITVEAPEFRAAAAGAIPEPDYEQITVEAAARLREDLKAMIESLDGMADEVRRRGRPLPGGGPGVVLEPEHRGDPGPPYWLVRQDPSDPTSGGSLFEQTIAHSDTVCGTCETPIVKGAPCYAIYVSPENRELLGYRCTNSICINGELIDELPAGAKRVK